MDDKTKERWRLYTKILSEEVACGRIEGWDADFIISVTEQFKSGKTLTPKQDAKLEELWYKY